MELIELVVWLEILLLKLWNLIWKLLVVIVVIVLLKRVREIGFASSLFFGIFGVD